MTHFVRRMANSRPEVGETKELISVIAMHWEYLALLDTEGELYLSELGGKIGELEEFTILSKSTVSGKVKVLEDHGLVDSEYRERRKYLHLTDKGVRYVQAILGCEEKLGGRPRSIRHSQVAHLLSAVNTGVRHGSKIPEDVGKSLTHAFLYTCRSYDVLQHDDVVEIFDTVLKDPLKFQQLNEEDIWRPCFDALKEIIAVSDRTEVTKTWFREVLKWAKDKEKNLDKDLRGIFVDILCAYFDKWEDLRANVLGAAREICFEKGVKLDDPVFSQAEKILFRCCWHGKDALFDIVVRQLLQKFRSGESTDREKAEHILRTGGFYKKLGDL